jgi:hypothetical protein
MVYATHISEPPPPPDELPPASDDWSVGAAPTPVESAAVGVSPAVADGVGVG